MSKCEIKFENNPNGIYYSGQTLSGVVELNNEKLRKIRGLSLRIEGFAKCKWTESEGSGKNRRTISYSGREDYIDTFSYLVGTSDVNQTELSPGLHKFNFSCQLPPQLPTSFESKYGYIRYQIKVEMERPWKFDVKFCFGFTIIKILDLNYESPALRSPVKTETTKSFFFGLASKSLFMSAEIPICGFVAGQTVPITIRINNESSVDVEEITVSLKKFIHYNSQTPRRKTRERMESAMEVRHKGILGKSKGHAEAHLLLPPVPPTNIAFCRVIQVTYAIHVVANVSGFHRNPVLRLPITMGTVPLQAYQYSSLPTVSLSNWNMQPSTSSALPPAQAPPYPPINDYGQQPEATACSRDLPPPSYHQAMGMLSNDTDNGEGLNDEKPFSPMYPVFDFGAPPLQSTFQMQPQSTDPPPSYGFAAAQYSEKK